MLTRRPILRAASKTCTFARAVSTADSRRLTFLSRSWYLPLFVALRFLPDPINPWVYWVLASLILAAPYAHGLQGASPSSLSSRARRTSPLALV